MSRKDGGSGSGLFQGGGLQPGARENMLHQ
jgi:hypothetical protein